MKQEIHMAKMCDTVTVQFASALFHLVRSLKKKKSCTAILVI